MNIFGLTIERTVKNEQEKFDRACKVIYDFNYRVVKQTSDKSNKTASAAKATQIRANRAKEKVLESMQNLKNEHSKVNVANIVKMTGVSRITAKKYMIEIEKVEA